MAWISAFKFNMSISCSSLICSSCSVSNSAPALAVMFPNSRCAFFLSVAVRGIMLSVASRCPARGTRSVFLAQRFRSVIMCRLAWVVTILAVLFSKYVVYPDPKPLEPGDSGIFLMAQTFAAVFEHAHDVDAVGVTIYDAQDRKVRAQGVDQVQELQSRQVGVSFAREDDALAMNGILPVSRRSQGTKGGLPGSTISRDAEQEWSG